MLKIKKKKKRRIHKWKLINEVMSRQIRAYLRKRNEETNLDTFGTQYFLVKHTIASLFCFLKKKTLLSEKVFENMEAQLKTISK